MKRMLSLLLVFAVTLATVGVVPVMTAVAAGNTAAPTDLKVDLRENPYGLETLDPKRKTNRLSGGDLCHLCP